VGAVLVAHDVTAARELSDKLARLALYDQKTGLPDRTLFADRLDRAIGLAERAETTFSLLYIDLDNFKLVNDTSGIRRAINSCRWSPSACFAVYAIPTP
jgi:GGDEF domain-containing protein